MRKFRSKLVNGEVVYIQEGLEDKIDDSDLKVFRNKLASLLDSDTTREMELLNFLQNILPVVIPSADLSKTPLLNPRLGSGRSRADLVYHLKDSDKLGLVETKNHLTAASKAVEQVYRYIEEGIYLESQGRTSFNEAYIIAGRGETNATPVQSLLGQTNPPCPINILSWDDVVEKLTVDSDDENPYTILLVEVVNASRKLLSLLLQNPKLLMGIDDRRFEELVATLLFDLGFTEIELTPPRKDGGRDIVAVYENQKTADREVYLFECKHWVSGNKVTLSWAISLREVLKNESAKGAILISSSGFGPKLLEQEATLVQDRVFLRDKGNLSDWVSIWQRQYGSVLIEPVDPLAVIGLS